MPVINLAKDLDPALAKKDAVAQGYTGDVPPAGSYRVTSGKTWLLKKTKADDWMVTIPLSIDDPKKKQYNGYTIWHNLVLGETSAPFVNAFLDALEIDRKAIWAGKMEVTGNKISRISGVSSLAGHALSVATKQTEYNGNTRLEITSASTFIAGEESHPDDDEIEDADEFDDIDEDDSF